MNALHPIFAVGTVAVGLLTASLFAYLSPLPPPKKYASLDGLRGILALLVLIQHAANWRRYAVDGVWALPPSRLYTHFGESSVALFFMITAFLFGSKLLEARTRPPDWLRLYVSRFLRLTPLYVSFVAALVVIALASSGFTTSVPRFGVNVLHWLAFTIFDMPYLNRFDAPIVGGAAWSLPYEWWFYLALPAMGVLVGARRTPVALICASAAVTGAAAYWITARSGWPIAAIFLGGWVAAFLARERWTPRVASHPAAGLVAIAALGAATRAPHGFLAASTVLLTVAFVIIACGNTLFGLLTSPPLRVLGEMGYSVYLLHGIGLYLAFSALGHAMAGRLTAVQHWMVVFAAVPLILGACRLTYRSIEAPAIAATDATAAKLRG